MDGAVRYEDPAVLYTNRTAEDKPSSKPADAEADFEKYLEKSDLGQNVSVELRERPWSPDLYYLHGDHLGTATFVTNSQAQPTQFFLNLPFGETMMEQMDGFYDNPFKFNAKELDDDTGLYYYGARYYNPRLSIWYGVDPAAEKMPSWSPYNYALDNPVKYVDPDGMAPENVLQTGCCPDSPANGSSLPDDPMEFASMIGGGFNSLRASVSNLFARGYNEIADKRVDRKYEVDNIGSLVLVTGVPKETRQEKIENTIGDLATIALSVGGGPEGMLMSQGGKAPALEILGDLKKTANMSVVKKGTPGWQEAIQTIKTQKKSDFLVNTASDAKSLLLGAQGNLSRYKNYTTKAYKKGYETHNVQNKRELGVGNDKQHLKWKNGKSSGHIFYKKPN